MKQMSVKQQNLYSKVLLLVFVSFIFSCSTDAVPPVDPVRDRGPTVQVPPYPSASDQDGGEVLEDPLPALQDPVVSEPVYAVTREVFDQTFDDVKKFIDELNGIIRNQEFDLWYRYLTPDFIVYHSNPDFLKQQNESRVLKSRGIVLKNLSDYFRFVVVPSRASVRLDDIFFLNENELEAIMVVNSRRVTVYRLIKIDNEWKIGLSTGP